jgi:MarR family transcriptional regulator for hemolysin
MQKPKETIFYTIDKAIRTYRQFGQRQLKQGGYPITVDQWLVITQIRDNPATSQQELAKKVFKDNASITRIIELLVKAGYLKRATEARDRRRVKLILTKAGDKLIKEVEDVVSGYRAAALKGISKNSLGLLQQTLQQLIANCEEH